MNNRILGIRDSHFLLLAFLLVYILPLGLRPLGIPDEMRYAEIPREMLSSGDWVVPYLNGVLYFEKPILGYWLNAISIGLFGENAFAVRLPSALLTGMSALLIFYFMKKLTDRRTALLAAIVQLSTLEIFFVGTYAVLDSLLAFTLCGVFVFYYLANTAQSGGSRSAYLFVTGIFCGLAFLSKGFLAFALPVIVIFSYLLYQRRFADLFHHAWIPLLTAALVAAPWAILIHQRAPDFWHYFFWVEHIKRFSADNAQHAAPIWTYVVAFPLLGFPWTLLVINGFRNLKPQTEQRQLIIYLAFWFVLPIAFFSIAKGKLLTYLLPIFPAFSMLIALATNKAVDNSKKIRWRGETIGFAFLIVIVLAIILLQASGNQRALFANNEQWQLAVLVASLLSGGYMLWRSMQTLNPQSRTLWIAATLLPFFLYWASYYGLPREISNRKTPGEFLSQQEKYLSDQTLIISDDSMFHAIAWVYKRNDIYMLNSGELDYGLSYNSTKFRNLEHISFQQFIQELPSNREIAVFYLGLKPLSQLNDLPKNITKLHEAHVGRFNFVSLKKS